MSDKQETIADIIAEMREIHVAEFQDYADRLEAAHERELAASGNAAAAREALQAFVRAYEEPIELDNIEATALAYDQAKAALAKPARNCDAMGWRTAWKTWREKFHPETPVGYSDVVKGTEAFMDWFTAPATGKEGGSNGN